LTDTGACTAYPADDTVDGHVNDCEIYSENESTIECSKCADTF